MDIFYYRYAYFFSLRTDANVQYSPKKRGLAYPETTTTTTEKKKKKPNLTYPIPPVEIHNILIRGRYE